MNQNPPTHPMGDMRSPNLQPRQLEGNISFNVNNTMGPSQLRPRMGQVNSSHQQKIPVNYQQGPISPQPVQGMLTPNISYQNMTTEEFQRMGGSIQGPRTFSGPQQRFLGPQLQQSQQPGMPQMRPLMNDPLRFMNQQQMDAMRAQTLRMPSNYSSCPDMSNSAPRNPPEILSRKSSVLEMPNNQQKLNESRSTLQKELEPKTNEKVEEIDARTQLKEAENFEDENLKNSDNNQDSIKSEVEEKEIKQKEKISKQKPPKPKIDCTIASGLVDKNIKFFEENDTAKTPLTPLEIKTERKQKPTKNVSSDVVKSEFYKDDYESGVDETPMVHPNLRSICQIPSKVARIPFLKTKKSKSKLRSEKKPKPRSSPMSPRSKRKSLHSGCVGHSKYWNNDETPYRISKKKEKTDYGPDEELLAFFEGSKSYRKHRRDGNYNNDQSGTKDRLVYKPTTNGDIVSPKKISSKLPAPSKKNPTLSSPTKTSLKSPGTPGPKSLPKTPESPSPPTPLIKKVPMNKIQVGAAPSPNLKSVRSKVGSLVNTTHKPGGGNIKIESHKIDFSKAQSRIAAKNDQYAPSGGDKKITQVKLQWSAKSKVGSLENATYKPGGGDKKIESVKLDFKEKAKPKVGSKDNVKHVPGGGSVKIENQKLEFKAQSKVGSLDNMKHKPGGGDIKIFDDKTYLKQISGNSSEGRVSGTQSYGDLSVVREVEGRSAPGTPGRKTAIKIKKTTTFNSTGTDSTLKNVTEVVVESQTPKQKKSPGKSSSKQQVKLTYSKIESPAKSLSIESPVKIVRKPVKEAPILKPNLDMREAFDGTKKNIKNLENIKCSTESTDFMNGKFRIDSGMTKFQKDELVAQEKVGEMWKEMNSLNSVTTPQPSQTFMTNTRSDFKVPERQKLTEPRIINPDLTQSSNYSLPQANFRTVQPQFFVQNQQQQQPHPVAQQRLTSHSFQSQETIFETSQQNPAFSVQFQENLSK